MYNRTRYSRGIVLTLNDVNTLPNPRLGETCFCSENGRVMTYDGDLWMCDDFVKATNASGALRSTGEIMIWQTTSGTATEVTVSSTSSQATLVAGVVIWNAAAGSQVALAYKGVYKVDIAIPPATYNRLGFFLRMSTAAATAGKGALITTQSSLGWFGWNIEILGGSGIGLTRCLLRGRPELS